jgi:ribosomal protein S18 acetylase RimI-like enzyme
VQSFFPFYLKSYSFSLPDSDENLSPKVQIRLATLDDISQIGRVLTLSFHQFNDLIWWVYPLIKLGVCQDLRNRLQANNPHYACIVAVIPANPLTGTKEKIIGTVELSVRSHYHWRGKKQYLYLANLAVGKGYRRQGIGSKLLKYCEQIATSWSFPQLHLHVLASNNRAQQLYWQNGYTIQQVETDLYSLFVTSKRRLLLTKSI